MTTPFVPSEPSGAYGVSRSCRPGGLMAVCVIAIVLGGLGLLGSLMAIVGLVAGPRLQQASVKLLQQPGNDKVVEAQLAMQQKIQAVNDRYRWPNAGFALLNVGLSVGLLAGGILALNREPRARTLLIALFAVALLFEISRSIVQVFMQWEMAAAMSDLLPRMMAASAPAKGPNAQQAAAIGTAIAKVGILLGLGFQLIFTVAKLTYYAVGWCYLRRPSARHWLENAGEGALAAGGDGA